MERWGRGLGACPQKRKARLESQPLCSRKEASQLLAALRCKLVLHIPSRCPDLDVGQGVNQRWARGRGIAPKPGLVGQNAPSSKPFFNEKEIQTESMFLNFQVHRIQSPSKVPQRSLYQACDSHPCEMGDKEMIPSNPTSFASTSVHNLQQK